MPDQLGAALKFHKGECDRNPRFSEDYAGLGIQRDTGLLGRVWTSGVPAVSASIASENSPVGASARKAELASMVAIPVLEVGRTKAIVAMYF